MEEICANCRFYKMQVEDIGACRKNPPTIINQLMRESEKGEENDQAERVFMATWFPIVHEGHWCGEWVAISVKDASADGGQI